MIPKSLNECYDCFVLISSANQRDIRLTIWPRTSSLFFKLSNITLWFQRKETLFMAFSYTGEHANTTNIDQKKKRKEKYSNLCFFQQKFVTCQVTWLDYFWTRFSSLRGRHSSYSWLSPFSSPEPLGLICYHVTKKRRALGTRMGWVEQNDSK